MADAPQGVKEGEIAMTEINYELMEKLSPKWAQKFKDGVTPNQTHMLMVDAGCCLVGCFYKYNGEYIDSNTEAYCAECEDFANTVTDMVRARIFRFFQEITVEQKRMLIQHGEGVKDVGALSMVRYVSELARKDLPFPEPFQPLSKMDEEGVLRLNQMLAEFYQHAVKEHEDVLVEVTK